MGLTVSTTKYTVIAEASYKKANRRKGNNHMGRTANDDRSDSMNPNNDAHWDSLDNHANQLNPNHDEYRGNEGDED